jgi:hypothetical protein
MEITLNAMVGFIQSVEEQKVLLAGEEILPQTLPQKSCLNFLHADQVYRFLAKNCIYIPPNL